jgi:hypothetical protein
MIFPFILTPVGDFTPVRRMDFVSNIQREPARKPAAEIDQNVRKILEAIWRKAFRSKALAFIENLEIRSAFSPGNPCRIRRF